MYRQLLGLVIWSSCYFVSRCVYCIDSNRRKSVEVNLGIIFRGGCMYRSFCCLLYNDCSAQPLKDWQIIKGYFDQFCAPDDQNLFGRSFGHQSKTFLLYKVMQLTVQWSSVRDYSRTCPSVFWLPNQYFAPRRCHKRNVGHEIFLGSNSLLHIHISW